MGLFLVVSKKSGFGCLYLAESEEMVERSSGEEYAVSGDSFSVRVIEGDGLARELFDSKIYLTPSQNLLFAARQVALEELRSVLRRGSQEDEAPEVELKRGVVVTCSGDELSSFVVTDISLLEETVVLLRGHWAASSDDEDTDLTIDQVVSESIPILTAAVQEWLGEL